MSGCAHEKCLRDGCVKCCYCGCTLVIQTPTGPATIKGIAAEDIKVGDAVVCRMDPLTGHTRVYKSTKGVTEDFRMKNYNVYINLELAGSVETEDEAWSIIGKAAFGSLYEVRDIDGRVREEFIPI